MYLILVSTLVVVVLVLVVHSIFLKRYFEAEKRYFVQSLNQTVSERDYYINQAADLQNKYNSINSESSYLNAQVSAYKQAALAPKDYYEERIQVLSGDAADLQVKYNQQLETNAKLLNQMKSSQVKLGHVSENLLPLLADFPYDSKKVRGLYNPIDLIVFEEDAIIFVEIKSGSAQLTTKQRHIKQLVDDGKVKFEIHRLGENGYERH